METEQIHYVTDLTGVDWAEVKARVNEDHFDNGRTPEQLKASFENSYISCIAYAGAHVIGKARALSDGVCNAYIVDVWTYTPYRHRGVASAMLNILFDHLEGQHIYLFTDEQTVPFYRQLGFKEQEIGLGKVVGTWLRPGGASQV